MEIATLDKHTACHRMPLAFYHWSDRLRGILVRYWPERFEQLFGISASVADPMLEFAKLQQPNTGFQAYQRQLLIEQAAAMP